MDRNAVGWHGSHDLRLPGNSEGPIRAHRASLLGAMIKEEDMPHIEQCGNGSDDFTPVAAWTATLLGFAPDAPIRRGDRRPVGRSLP